MVTVEHNYRVIKVYINDLLHITIYRKRLSGMQAWVDKGFRYVIEFTLSDGSLKIEYDNKELWEEVLTKIDPYL